MENGKYSYVALNYGGVVLSCVQVILDDADDPFVDGNHY
jgi:hypothetical protein